MASWSIKRVHLPLKFNWTIARGSADSRENLYITYQDGDFVGMGEVAFLTGAGKPIEEVEQKFQTFVEEVPKTINGLEDMMAILEKMDFDEFLALRFGLESAYVHFLAQLLEGSVQSVLGISSISKCATSYSLPILELGAYKAFIEEHRLKRFDSLKLKVTRDNAIDIVKEVRKEYAGDLWIDANESFEEVEEVLEVLNVVAPYRVILMEQPFAKNHYQKYLSLKKENRSGILIIADESLGAGPITSDYGDAFDGVNIKLMKSGGYFNALKQLRSAKKLNLKVLVGCMLESSLGIYSALNISAEADFIDLDSTIYLKNDPLNLVFEERGMIQFASNQ